VRLLYPHVADEDPHRTYAELWGPLDEVPAGRGLHVALGMVSSVDGGASVEGRTAHLGGAADRIAFGRLREACDVILVGAETVRAERYGPPVGDAARRRRRRERGLAEVPELAIVTRSLSLDPAAAVFADATTRPLLLTTDAAAAAAPAGLREVAEVVGLGGASVEPARVTELLARRGLRRVLCEGGPSLAAQLLAADLVDELFVTLHPVALGGLAPRIAQGVVPAAPRELVLAELREHAGELLLRYRRDRAAGGHPSSTTTAR
jgi:riboflavin biosynthesis pyrimidine reductase